MTYQLGHVELGDDAGLSYCSTVSPKAGCTPIPGVVVPMNTATLTVFKHLQIGINRLLSRVGVSMINIDGRIGGGTLTAYKKAVASIGASSLSVPTVDALAAVAETEATRLNQRATQIGAPALAVPPPSASNPRPSMPGPNGTVINPPPTLLESIGFSSNGSKPMLIGLAAIGGFLFLRKGKKRRGRR